MKTNVDVDTILAPLVSAFRGRTDTLLDIHENALHAKNPGACVASYFELRKDADAWKTKELSPLKTWLEENIEIVARDGRGHQLETLPLGLREDTLEGYCQSIIREFQEDRVYKAASIGITFRYKEE